VIIQRYPVVGLPYLHVTLGGVLLALCAGTSACLYDSEDSCGDDRMFEGTLCVCKKGTVDKEGECVKAEPKPDPKPATDAGSGESGGGLGAACADEGECENADFPTCHVADGEDDGYCTKNGCSADADCADDGFYCTGETPRFCKRLPTGQGETCTSQDDCKGYDASYCTIGNPFGVTCAVPNCSENSCAPGFMCMDFSMFAPGTPKLCTEPR
jgi:hypothetical protein